MSSAKRIVAVVSAALVAVGTVFLTAPHANAETLHLKHANTVKIKPASIAPSGAKVTKAVITVKKGSKTVAKNKASYRAKRGTYKVTTTATYRLPRRITADPAQVVGAECRITTMKIISDRTSWIPLFDGLGYYYGQVTLRYTGTCTDTISIGGAYTYVKWSTAWSDDESIFTPTVSSSADRNASILANCLNKVGDVDYVSGHDMSTLPTARAWSSAKTAKATRTVKVKE